MSWYQKSMIALFGIGVLSAASVVNANAQEKHVETYGKAPTDVRAENPITVSDGMVIDAIDTKGTADPADDAVMARDTVNQGYYQHNIPVYKSVAGNDSIPQFYNAIHFDDAVRVMHKNQELNDSIMTNEIPIDGDGNAQQSTGLPDTYFDSSPITSTEDIIFREVDMTVYPNPGDNYRNVSFNLKKGTENLRINIYNSAGQLVHAENLGEYTPGEHVVELYKELRAGNYFVELKGRDLRSVRQIVEL